MADTTSLCALEEEGPAICGPMVDITIEGHRQKLHFHAALLAARSTTFKDLIRQSDESAGSPCKISLSNTAPETIRMYLRYLYAGKLFCLEEGNSKALNQEEDDSLVALLVFAERMGDSDAADAAIIALVQGASDKGLIYSHAPSTITAAYKGTNGTSRLRRLVVASRVWSKTGMNLTWNDDGDTVTDEEGVSKIAYPTDFIINLAETQHEAMKELANGKAWPERLECCHYHGEDKECPSKKRKRGDDSENE